MKRNIFNKLIDWKNSPLRKPLILMGARQVGKTWLLKKLGEEEYKNTIYISFELNIEYAEIFKRDRNPKRIINELSYLLKIQIEPQETLIIFDEIQNAPDVLASLKYFYEEANEYHIACAGSLLGITIAKPYSFPVGKVSFINVYPMTFDEFLGGIGEEFLANFLKDYNLLEPISTPMFNELYDKLKLYYIIGGMPEAVLTYSKNKDLSEIDDILYNLITSYHLDFAKHPSLTEFPKLSAVFNSIPSQLAKENKKFLFNLIKTGARAREYENALEWLINARIFYKIYRNKSPKLPVSAYDDISSFKMYLLDVAILRRLAKISSYTISEGDRLFTEFKGSLTENFILEQLITQFELPRYWSIINPSHEVDFLIENKNKIIPIEVKSDHNIRSRSLQKYQELYKDEIKLRIRFSLENLNLDGNLLNIPLFMASETKRIIELANKQLGIN